MQHGSIDKNDNSLLKQLVALKLFKILGWKITILARKTQS